MIKKFENMIENVISANKQIIICVCVDDAECRNTVIPETVEFDQNQLSLISGNYELHVDLTKYKITYDEAENSFTFNGDSLTIHIIII